MMPWGRSVAHQREYDRLFAASPASAARYVKNYEEKIERYRRLDAAVLRAFRRSSSHHGEWRSGIPMVLVTYPVYLGEELAREFPGISFKRQIDVIASDTRNRFPTRMDESEYLHEHLEKQLKRRCSP